MSKSLRLFGRLILWVVLLAATAWGSAALWFDGPASRPLAGLLAAAFPLAAVALLILLRVIKAGRLHYFSYYCWTVSLAAVAYFWYLAGRQ